RETSLPPERTRPPLLEQPWRHSDRPPCLRRTEVAAAWRDCRLFVSERSSRSFYTSRVTSCSLRSMARPSTRVNIVLSEEHALKLRRIAERTHTNPGTI